MLATGRHVPGLISRLHESFKGELGLGYGGVTRWRDPEVIASMYNELCTLLGRVQFHLLLR